MKHLLLLAALLYAMAASAQTITNKKGHTFDVETLESGDVVEYDFYQQGVLIFRNITVNGIKVFKFSSPKKTVMLINGKRVPLGRNVKNMMIKFFRSNGLEFFDSNKRTVLRGGGNNLYVGNSATVTFIKP